MSMVYRIRYKEAQDAGEVEALVEANSLTEAIVKFRHSRTCAPEPAPEQLIKSIYAEYYGQESAQ
jgi:hypothetical protein